MAGGGTGGHVVPSLAVAAELRLLGHDSHFIGSAQGVEATLVPRAGFPVEFISASGFQRAGLRRQILALGQLPLSVARSAAILGRLRPAALFSMGGYVAAPPMLAAILLRIPIVLMEPNAMPGLVSRRLARFAARTLLSFEDARRHFPAGSAEMTGLPVRHEFFSIEWRPPPGILNILITGGSRGARSLNSAARESWPLFRQAAFPVCMTLQAGAADAPSLEREFAATGLDGRVIPFIDDMPSAYSSAHLVISRSGAGAVSELAAAGMPSILVPFPFAADDHQSHNAAAFSRAGAALLIPDAELTGRSLFDSAARLAGAPGELERMSRAARSLARPGAAPRAARLLLDFSRKP